MYTPTMHRITSVEHENIIDVFDRHEMKEQLNCSYQNLYAAAKSETHSRVRIDGTLSPKYFLPSQYRIIKKIHPYPNTTFAIRREGQLYRLEDDYTIGIKQEKDLQSEEK